ncbi:MAG: hypothetical protein DBO99_13195 [gamma proteobacterium symbiont of Ctena orbiculata]|nr:MAG: hypothetical protein DBO99_13195 [gamma proteobacterium symbiont of Ctena orbiculata]
MRQYLLTLNHITIRISRIELASATDGLIPIILLFLSNSAIDFNRYLFLYFKDTNQKIMIFLNPQVLLVAHVKKYHLYYHANPNL